MQPTVAKMNREGRSASNEMKNLLNRQLASIANALAQASSQSNENLRIRRNSTVTSTVADKALAPPSHLIISSKSTALGASDSRAELDHQRNGFNGYVTNGQATSLPTNDMPTNDYVRVSVRKAPKVYDEGILLDTTARSTNIPHLPKTISDKIARGPREAAQLLADLEREASISASLNDQKKAFRDSALQNIQCSQDLSLGHLYNLKAHPANAPVIISAKHGLELQDRCCYNAGTSDGEAGSGPLITAALDKRVIECAVALELEHMSCEWKLAQGWTTYIFSSGLEGQQAQQNKIAMIARATKNLESIMHRCTEEEREKLACRLIVSNLATDAGEDEVRSLLYRYRFDIRDIIILKKHHPLQKTKIAYVDMWSRQAALRTSYVTGHIFGLMVDISLAEKETS